MHDRGRPIAFLAILAAMALIGCTTNPGTTAGPTGSPTAAGTGTPASPAATQAGPWVPEYVDGVLQPLPDGFPDQEITLMVPDDSLAEHVLMTDLQAAAREMSPVPIVVETRTDFEAFGTWDALKQFAGTKQADDGYLNIVFSIGSIADLHTAPVTSELGLTLDNVGEVVQLETRPYVVVQCAEVEWEPTWQALMDQIKSKPGTVRFMGGGPGTGTDMVFAHYINILGVGNLYDKASINHINVGGVADRTTATAACEGDLTVSTLDAAPPHIEGGRLDVILVSGTERLPQYPDAPSRSELGIEQDASSSTKQLVVSGVVPDLHVAWLYELWSKAGASEDYQEARLGTPGTIIQMFDPAKTEETNAAVYALLDKLTRDLGIHIP